MNEGVQIILERMKTHPEEFVPPYNHGATKWGGLINHYNEYLTKEESETLSKKMRETVISVMRERFTKDVMKELLDPKEDGVTLTNIPHPVNVGYANASSGLTLTVPNGGAGAQWANTTAAGHTTLNANSLKLGNTEINEETLKHIKAHEEYLRQQQIRAVQEEVQKQKTLVGKLKNYLHAE